LVPQKKKRTNTHTFHNRKSKPKKAQKITTRHKKTRSAHHSAHPRNKHVKKQRHPETYINSKHHKTREHLKQPQSDI
jgi:hypothetical protein